MKPQINRLPRVSLGDIGQSTTLNLIRADHPCFPINLDKYLPSKFPSGEEALDYLIIVEDDIGYHYTMTIRDLSELIQCHQSQEKYKNEK